MIEEVDASAETQGSTAVSAEADELSPVGGIVDWVALGIIEGRLQAGDDLNSVDLARRFGVSRTPVREALFVLSREGLVDWSPRRRPRVSAVSLKEVQELYQLRAMLYAQVSIEIVTHATDDDIKTLWDAHKPLSEAAMRGDVDAYFWANVAFRDVELRVSRHGIFTEVLNSMRLRTNRLRHLSTTLPGRLERSCEDHQRLCEAYAERDATLAAALNRSIVMSALRAIELAWTE